MCAHILHTNIYTGKVDILNNDIDNFSLEKFQEKLMKIIDITRGTINTTIVDMKIIIKAYILNWYGLFVIVCSVLTMLVEMFKLHKTTVLSSTLEKKKENEKNENEKNGNENNYIWSYGNKFFEAYIIKRKILMNAIIFTFIFILAIVGWLNLISRKTAILFIFKFIILWTMANYISFFMYNYIRIKPYLPTNRIELYKNICKLSWWLWLLPRLFTSEGFLHTDSSKEDNGVFTAILIIFMDILKDVIGYYPYYYFYYYNEYFYTHKGDDYGRRRDIFLINMILQLSISMCVYYYSTILTIGSPQYIIKMIKKNTYTSIYNSQTFLSGHVLILLANIVLTIVRVIWYFFISNSTWFQSMIIFFFILNHISIFINIMPITSAMIDKDDIR
jgi:hypothetical protein